MKATRYAMLLLVLILAWGTAWSVRGEDDPLFTDTFFLENCTLSPRGVNDYFLPLIPGSYILLEGEEENDEGEVESLSVLIRTLRRTKVVDGVRCAVVREMEWADGELTEISWNYFAICTQHRGIFYFGEDVDIYEDGEVVAHDGAWLAGRDGAEAGLLMPGLPLIGSRYFQEVAPGVALDRAEHVDNLVTVETPAGTFENCLYVVETTPLEPDEESFKAYARGVGLILDDVLRLTDYGCRRGRPH